MIIEDKLIYPYRINIDKYNVNLEKHVPATDKTQERYDNKGCFSTIDGALRKITRLKQAKAQVTINLEQYARGIRMETEKYETILKSLNLVNISEIKRRIEGLEKELKQLLSERR